MRVVWVYSESDFKDDGYLMDDTLVISSDEGWADSGNYAGNVMNIEGRAYEN